MYEELIQQCQNCLDSLCGECKYEHLQKPGNFVLCMNALLKEAANAIEELQAQLMYSNDAAKAIAEKVPKWIPTIEKLPELTRKSYWVCTDIGYQCECRWTNNQFGFGESDEWGWSIFDIPQYQKVVAWMQLPKPYEPPKECEI